MFFSVHLFSRLILTYLDYFYSIHLSKIFKRGLYLNYFTLALAIILFIGSVNYFLDFTPQQQTTIYQENTLPLKETTFASPPPTSIKSIFNDNISQRVGYSIASNQYDLELNKTKLYLSKNPFHQQLLLNSLLITWQKTENLYPENYLQTILLLQPNSRLIPKYP